MTSNEQRIITTEHDEERGTQLFMAKGAIHIGRIASHGDRKGFQPTIFMEGLLSAAALREIADLIEQEEK